jgi:hypothetical protein
VLLRPTSLVNPFPPPAPFVLLDDGSGDLWWIDRDGDILFWDDDSPPNFDFEVRRTSVRMDSTDDNAKIEAAFASSVPVTYVWPSTSTLQPLEK